MTAAKHSDTPSSLRPLVSERQPSGPLLPPQYVVFLPPHLPTYRGNRLLRKSCQRRLICSAVLLIFRAAAYVLWPSDPKLSVVRLSLDRLHFHTTPKISLDVTLDMTIKVWNKDFYSIDYDSMDVAIGYRGRRLGFMSSDGGRIRARRSSYVNATLQLDGADVLSDAILLIQDLAKGEITFDTETAISGKLGLFFSDLPLKGEEDLVRFLQRAKLNAKGPYVNKKFDVIAAVGESRIENQDLNVEDINKIFLEVNLPDDKASYMAWGAWALHFLLHQLRFLRVPAHSCQRRG
ncbi:hypothetical protein OROGR_011814 [Orobanche gracilis]